MDKYILHFTEEFYFCKRIKICILQKFVFKRTQNSEMEKSEWFVIKQVTENV